MRYQVVLNDRAENQLEAAFQWWSEHRSESQAVRWYNRFLGALDGLRANPERCSIALETQKFGYEVRQLLFGLGRRATHRALFTIRPSMVYVFSIRHVAQNILDPEDI